MRDEPADSSIVSLAAVTSALSGAVWPAVVVIALMRARTAGGQGHFLDHPWVLTFAALQCAGFLASAWLLEKNRWQGAALASFLYAVAILRAIVRDDSLRTLSVVTIGAFLLTLLALRILWPRRKNVGP